MDFAEFKRHAREFDAVVLTVEAPADLLTPVGAFICLGGHRAKWSFLLESVEGGETIGRYSFIGVNPDITMTLDGQRNLKVCGPLFGEKDSNDPFEAIRSRVNRLSIYQESATERLPSGWVGYLGYDVAGLFEHLPQNAPDILGHPILALGFFRRIVRFDQVRQSVTICHTVFPKSDNERVSAVYDEAQRTLEETAQKFVRHPKVEFPKEPEPIATRSNFKRDDFKKAVHQVKSHIRAGDIYQGVISQRFSVAGSGDSFGAYRRLRRSNPSPYMYYLRTGKLAIAGSSPETLVSKTGSLLTVRPIAGTRPRGRNIDEDKRLEQQLVASPKENAEHVMLVDLGRNDLGRVARTKSVSPDRLAVVERYSHVMHLVSEITAKARPGIDAVDVLRASFPAGTLTGAPKIRAMEIVDSLEPDRRGVYGGGIGYIDLHGNMDMAIAIRTIVFDNLGAHVQAGAGIVADSDPDREFEETCNKAAAPLAACGGLIKPQRHIR